MLERTRDRMVKWLRRRGLLVEDSDSEDEGDGRAVLAASAVSGTTPPAGPEWRRGALLFECRPMVFERPLCVALDGFTLHAATRAGGHDEAGREALLKYVLRPAVAQERVTRGPDGLVRITLKKPFSDGTVAVDMDPLSLLSRPRRRYPRRACTPFGMRGCSRRRVRFGLVWRRSRRLLQYPRWTCPRDRAEAAIVRGRSFLNGPLGSTF
ncbi:MAG: transposase [Myxococcales bacterium]|nr:transposase [Myxococcales bacterium]